MKYLFLLLLTCSCVNLLAQKQKELKEYFLLYDKDGNPVKEFNVAATFKAITIENDSTYVVRYYENNGPMIWRQTFKDAKLTIPNGWFAWYDENGNIKTSGNMVNGKKDQFWAYYNYSDTGNAMNSEYYKLGKLISKDEFYNSSKQDTTHTYAMVPAEYKKGTSGWKHYLSTHLDDKPGRFIQNFKKLRNGRAEELITFTISETGDVTDMHVIKSSGYIFDKEAIRVIGDSPKWRPASIDGKNVPFYQTQKIEFNH